MHNSSIDNFKLTAKVAHESIDERREQSMSVLLGHNDRTKLGKFRTKTCLCLLTLAPADKAFFGNTEGKH